MSNINNFAELAAWLIGSDIGLQAHIIQHGNGDILGTSDDEGPLSAAHDCLCAGDLLAAVAHLDTSIKLALKPVEQPTTGRNQMQRFRAATEQRDNLRRTAQVARVLVLDAIKVEGGAA